MILAVFLMGCGEKELTIDASSPDSLKTSTQAIYQSLKGDEAAKFKEATLNAARAARMITNKEDEKVEIINKLIGGKTAKEIIAMDKKMNEQR
jgi:N6-adenosine-specific RNA methylase IME4